MATFADDEDIDFEELWGSGGGGVDVNGNIIKVEGRQADTTTEFGDEVWPGAAALAEALAPNGVFGGAVRGKRVLELGAGGGLPGLVCAAAGAAHNSISRESSSNRATKAQAVTEACDDDGALRDALRAALQQYAQASINDGALPSLTMRSPRAATARTRSAAIAACSGVFAAAAQASAADLKAASARSSEVSRNVDARCRAASRSDELGGKRAAKRRATSRAAVATAASPSLISSTQTSAKACNEAPLASIARAQQRLSQYRRRR